jgi:hypothetical protein
MGRLFQACSQSKWQPGRKENGILKGCKHLQPEKKESGSLKGCNYLQPCREKGEWQFEGMHVLYLQPERKERGSLKGCKYCTVLTTREK